MHEGGGGGGQFDLWEEGSIRQDLNFYHEGDVRNSLAPVLNNFHSELSRQQNCRVFRNGL